MGTEWQVMQDYLGVLVKRADFPAYFTDDVVATFEGTDQRADGRAAAGQLIRYVPRAHSMLGWSSRTCWSMTARQRSRRTSSAPIPASSPEFKPRAGQSGSRTRSSTTSMAIRSARCGFTSR
jgi:hypothetical protein